MKGYGLLVHNCINVLIANCSYYHSYFDLSEHYYKPYMQMYGGGVGIVYDTQYSNTGYTLELSHSNMTNCSSSEPSEIGGGGGISLQAKSRFGSVRVLLSHLVLSYNTKIGFDFIHSGAGLSAVMTDNGNVSLTITNCVFFHGYANYYYARISDTTGGMYFFVDTTRVVITIQNTDLVENEGFEASEIYFQSFNSHDSSLSILNSTITHTETESLNGVSIKGCCTRVIFNNTRMRLTKQIRTGVFVDGHFQGFGSSVYLQSFRMDNCIIDRSQSVKAILFVSSIAYLIKN